MEVSAISHAPLEFTSPPIQRFGKEERPLLDILIKKRDVTTIQYLQHPAELQLGNDGRTLRGGYTMTKQAFAKIAHALSTGLSRVVSDVGGAARGLDRRDALVDGAIARTFWNRVVELRFPLVREHRLVRDEKLRVIDGALGPRQAYLDNHAVLGIFSECFHNSTLPLFGAVLQGRTMLLWFRGDKKRQLATSIGPILLRDGVYAASNEFSGTLRATKAILTSFGVLLGPYRTYGCRTMRVSRNLTPRRLVPLTAVPDAMDEFLDTTAEHIQAADSVKLGFNLADTQEQIMSKTERLATTLAAHGAPPQLARKISDRVLLWGGQSPAGTSLPIVSMVVAERTRLDAVAAACRFAGGLDIYRRERVELAAWKYLVTGGSEL